MNQKLILILIIIWVIILDLFTKNLAREYFQNQINLIWDYLYFKYVLNNWIAFWIQLTWLWLKIITIILVIIIWMYYFLVESKRREILITIAFWLILGGAMANGYERIFHEVVIDFIWMKYFSVFNIADICISLWVVIYLGVEILSNRRNNDKYST